MQGLRDSVVAIGSQSELTQTLITHQIAGPAYLEDLSTETAQPLLVLPT